MGFWVPVSCRLRRIVVALGALGALVGECHGFQPVGVRVLGCPLRSSTALARNDEVRLIIRVAQATHALGSAATARRRKFAGNVQAGGMLGLRADVSVTLSTPLGIVFEEVENGAAKGLMVAGLVPGGNAERDGKILVGDKLIATSAVVLDKSNQPLLSLGGAGATNNWRREMIPVGSMDFNSVMAAIKSNSGRYGYKDVRLTLRRTDKSVVRSTDTIIRNTTDDSSSSSNGRDLPLKVRQDPWE